MTSRPHSGGSRRLAAGLFVSALAHILLFALLMFAIPERPSPTRRDKVSLEVFDRASRQELENAPLVTGTIEPRADDTPDGQIVTLPEPPRQQRPESSRFLSQYDIKVDREQVSRVRGGAPPGKAGKAVARRVMPAPGDGKPAGSGGEQADVTPEEKPDEGLNGGRPAVTFSGLRGFENLLLPSSAAGGRGGGLNMRALADELLSDDSLAMSGDGAEQGTAGGGGFGGGSDDVFMGVEDEGDVTLVNSRSFKFWAFFDRIKTQVKAEWDPGTTFRSRDPYGKVFGQKDRYTILGVVLGSDGAIRQLEVVHKSGLDFLDEEAVRAFQAAGPFPNPPTGLIDESGRIVFRFGFLLEFGASTGSFFWQRPN